MQQIKVSVVNRPTVIGGKEMEGGDVFYSPMVRSESLMGLYPRAVNFISASQFSLLFL